MKKNLIADYLACFLFRAISLFSCFLPLNFSLFLGRRLGDLIYFFDLRHRAIVYANMRKALNINCASLKRLVRKSYRAFGQNLAEISFIPRINKKYIKKYIKIENQDCIDQAFKRGKGVIFLIVHEGNWELSNIICANFGFPFVLFVRDQGFPRLNALLNSYRLKKGARIIHKDEGGARKLIEALLNNESIGMTVDQGGKRGEIVRFFGKEASMSVGAVKLALKYDCSIIPVFYTRVKGPYTKIILDQAYTVSRTSNPENDIKENLQRLINIYEKYIRQYPQEYLWTYKIWKYGKEKDILILSDGKTGHLRQSEGVARLLEQELTKRQIKTSLSTLEIKFRSDLHRSLFKFFSAFSGKFQCQGCLGCLRWALTKETVSTLGSIKPDIIISAGGSLSGVNYLLSGEHQAKSVLLMRPENLGLKRFNLVIMPEHDALDGLAAFFSVKKRKNVVITEGALNVIDEEYLFQKAKSLKTSGLFKNPVSGQCIGILIGGNSKRFSMDTRLVTDLSFQIKRAAEELNADILVSTSRRTSVDVEKIIKHEFSEYPRAKLLVIANENNYPGVVGGILGLSNIVICSPESISMISESVSAGKYVFVFKAGGLSKKHARFLKNFEKKGYIYFKEIKDLAEGIKNIWHSRPKINTFEDKSRIREALNKII